MYITNARIVSDNKIIEGDIYIKNGRIEAIGCLSLKAGEAVVDANGRWLFPGAIDDQVHFREPGLTHKADIASESRAAVAGGVTSYMEMPNVKPPTLTMEKIEEKRAIAAKHSLANYAFYLGASTDNLANIRHADVSQIAGIKIFMGSSTGNMLVDDEKVLEQIFLHAPVLIAVHCENSQRIVNRLEAAKKQYGEDIAASQHAIIRDAMACYESSSKAVALAKQTGARLHILHITTARELELFEAGFSLHKQITAEACAHHLLFHNEDYAQLGMRLKCNPAVKTLADRQALRKAIGDGRIDVLATDHAPHLLEEKELNYQQAAAGLPLVEYALPAFLQLVASGDLSLNDVARLSAHRVADLFNVIDRGYIREGFFADLVMIEKTPEGESGVRSTVLSKCGWTPFADYHFDYRVFQTYVNGHCVWENNTIIDKSLGQALQFNR